MPKASTRRPGRASSSARACRPAEREELGRAEHVRRPAELAPAPAPARRERHRRSRLLGDGGAPRRSRASVAFRARRARGESTERVRELALVDAVGRDERPTWSRASVSVPVLSRQIDVDRGERLDRVQLLRERAPAGHPQRGDGVGEARRAGSGPPGTSVTTAATAVGTASCSGVCAPRARSRARRRAGTMTPTSMSSSRLIARSSGERGWRNSRASPAIARRVALRADRGRRRTRPRPRRRTSRSAPPRRRRAATGSDSPVRIDSSSASPSLATQRAVGDDLVARLEQDEVAARRPRRRATARGAAVADDASRSARRAPRAGRARASRAPPARCRSPRSRRARRGRARPATRRTRASATPATSRIRLKTVKTLARTMLA